MKSDRLLAFYENARQQVEKDMYVGGLYRFAVEGVRQYADELRKELERRRLKFTPIDWPETDAVGCTTPHPDRSRHEVGDRVFSGEDRTNQGVVRGIGRRHHQMG